MSKKQCVFDERLYPVAWRFNAEDCLLSDSEKKQIVLFDSSASEKLWDEFIPSNNLMQFDSTTFRQADSVKLSFSDRAESALAFAQWLKLADAIWFFWSRSSAAMVTRSVFLKAWDDFFTRRMRARY
ncbi:hypothetical protein BLX41_05355 [Pseudomonas protegens]|uniref:hypothetical protein n=1 Tax=Pseudomonas protegens TaxID=380021 RepID=UPI000FF67F9C|nr:hypothetical protein [Pseudomonas protegens]ROL81436.1 hypothetical protein BLX41_05355 [Pseudomonas protegens]